MRRPTEIQQFVGSLRHAVMDSLPSSSQLSENLSPGVLSNQLIHVFLPSETCRKREDDASLGRLRPRRFGLGFDPGDKTELFADRACDGRRMICSLWVFLRRPRYTPTSPPTLHRILSNTVSRPQPHQQGTSSKFTIPV